MLIAIIGTGPSLYESLEEIKTYPAIMTCSRAHNILLENGIVPTYHVDIDPRPGKVPSRIHGSVRYLLGDSVHSNYRVSVPNASRAVSGGTQAGDTAILTAYQLGYREIHCFGYDACGHGSESFTFQGKSYRVDDNLLGSIVCFENACAKCPGIRVTVHGDGLLRAYLDRKYGKQLP